MTTQSPTTAQTKPKRDGGVQPRKQASKSRAVVKMRRKQIIKDILAGKTQQEAGISAGFSPKTAADQVSKTLRNPLVQDALQSAMEKIGMDDDYLADHHKQLIEATKVIAANVFVPGSATDLADAGSMTKDFVEVPDFQSKAKGLEMLYKLRGKFTEKHDVNVKRPLTILVRRFCAEDDALPVSGSGGAAA
jgi:phage terminase small subunit